MITYEYKDKGYVAYKWGVYPEWSVLAGQPSKQWVGWFGEEWELLEVYPDAVLSHRLLEADPYFDHLLDGGDLQ